MQTEALPHGGHLHIENGRVVSCFDARGHEAWSARWDEGRLEHLRLRRPDRSAVWIRPNIGQHPLLGPCGGIYEPDATEPLARFAALDWAAPERIVPIDIPAAIPGGAGTALLNVIALLAERSGRAALRYEGPYPTAALFDSLMASFRVVGDPASALERFTTDVEAKAVRGEMTEVPIDFRPAPHVWTWPSSHVCCQLREGVERVYLKGRAFERLAASHRRLVAGGDHFTARIDFAGRPWCEVLTVDGEGSVLDGPHPLPTVPSALCGTELPSDLRHLLGEIFASRAPALLAPAILSELAERPVVWADTGVDACRIRDGRFELHAVLGERLPELEATPMLAHLGSALEPVVRRVAQRRLAAKG